MLIAASSQKSSPPGRNARSLCTLLAASLVGAALIVPAPALAEMRGSSGGHGGYRGGGMMGVGAGVAIGGIIGSVIQQSAQRPPEVVQSQPRRASGKESAKTRSKKKDVARAKPAPVKQDAQHPNCEQCKPLAESIAKYETMLAEEKARLAAEENEKKRHEAQLARFNRAFDDPMRKAWTEAIAGNTARIADIQALIAQIEAVLKSRKDQLAAHTKPPEVASKPKDKEEQVASVPKGVPVTPVVGVPTSPGTSTPPSVSTPPSTPPSTPSQSGPPSTSPPTGTTTTTTPRTSTPAGTPTATPTGLTTTTPPTTSGGLATAAKGPCEDHWAELSNGKRVFHRVYVIGTTKTKEERDKWLLVMKGVQDGFKAPNRQAAGSTEKVVEEPTTAEFAQLLQNLKDTVQPCEEVTLYLTAHGGGGVDYGQGTKTEGDAKAEYAVLKQRRNPTTKEVEANELIDDVAFGKMVQGFKPNVSFTLIASSCYGGGFSGLNNIQEGKLVKVIGLYTQCTSSGTLEAAIRDGMNRFAEQNPDGRAMVNDVKDYLREKGWPLGVPMDDARDQYVQENIKQFRPD